MGFEMGHIGFPVGRIHHHKPGIGHGIRWGEPVNKKVIDNAPRIV
jgi:hypothetical protein